MKFKEQQLLLTHFILIYKINPWITYGKISCNFSSYKNQEKVFI